MLDEVEPWTRLCGNAPSYHTQRGGFELPRFARADSRGLRSHFRAQVLGQFLDSFQLIAEVFRHLSFGDQVHLWRDSGGQLGQLFRFPFELHWI